MAIKEQVNEMERGVSKTEILALIRNDPKERLKDLRKSVIKRQLHLQERVDAIISSDQSVVSGNAEADDQSQGIIVSSDNCNQILESENLEETTNDADCLGESEGTVVVSNQGNEDETLETTGNESQIDSFVNHENAVEEEDGNGKKESGRKEMLKDNEKMMRLMEALSERNEMQLEKAFMGNEEVLI
ncbi:hypothetical protein V6N11_043194 [Hibiscus sabdariffa]|uniref:Uncharacterized protein n=1 Tax=Hibiscus sabdariffa TaxID=183260 RepID=A0ABR2QYK6_9ROSI